MEAAAFFCGVIVGVFITRSIVWAAMLDRYRALNERDELQAQVDMLVTRAATRPRCIREEL